MRQRKASKKLLPLPLFFFWGYLYMKMRMKYAALLLTSAALKGAVTILGKISKNKAEKVMSKRAAQKQAEVSAAVDEAVRQGAYRSLVTSSDLPN
jgi:hypothetical protein